MPFPNRQTLLDLILDSLREESVALPASESERLGLKLVGEGAVLKSVGLVGMLVGVEDRLSELHKVDLSLMDERAMGQSPSPFRTVETLLDYMDVSVRQKPL